MEPNTTDQIPASSTQSTVQPAEVSSPPRFGKRLLISITRICIILIALATIGCYLIAQPSSRSNKPSTKTIDETRLRSHVVALSETFHPRDWLHPSNLDRSADYIAKHFELAGAKTERQKFVVEKQTYQNVIARFGTGKNKKIIIGAHYDSCGETPGADDNASGIAGLIELAYLIGKNQTDVEIELVAYTLEEPPFFSSQQMGSAFHANRIASEKDRIIGVIILEMIGYFSDEPNSQNYPLPILKAYYPSRGNFITVVSKWDQSKWIADLKAGMKGSTDLPVYSFRGPVWLPGIDYSDHRNYWPHDIPAAMITNTAFYRNTAYHTKHDTADRLDYNRMAKVVIATYEAIHAIMK